jgi:hypothetical protein
MKKVTLALVNLLDECNRKYEKITKWAEYEDEISQAVKKYEDVGGSANLSFIDGTCSIYIELKDGQGFKFSNMHLYRELRRLGWKKPYKNSDPRFYRLEKNDMSIEITTYIGENASCRLVPTVVNKNVTEYKLVCE